MDIDLQGTWEPAFEPVAAAFAANVADGSDAGAACAVYVDGQRVVDVWAGLADVERGRPWERDTVVPVYSTTKGIAAACVHLLIARGEIDVDAPVADHWPAFAAGGKGSITVRQLLSHQAGLSAVDGAPTMDEVLAVDPVIERLAAQGPLWEPGTRHGYHAITFGWLVSGLVRHVTGRTIGQYLATEISPKIDGDFYIGLPREAHPRMARVIDPPPPDPGALAQIADEAQRRAAIDFAMAIMDPASITNRSFFLGGVFAPGAQEEPAPDERADAEMRFYAAEMPGMNGVGDARSIAGIYAACVSDVDGFRVMDDDQATAARAVVAGGADAVLFTESRFGLGFWLPTPASPMLTADSFGHPGMGGSIGFADPVHRVGFGYVLNRLGGGGMQGDPRKHRIIGALRQVLGGAGD